MATKDKELKKAEEPAPAEEEAQAAVVPALVVTFDRYFATLGRPEHWKAGMRAYKDTSGKRTIAAWTAIFKNY